MTITEAILLIQKRQGYLNKPILETLEWMDKNWWLLDWQEQMAHKKFMQEAGKMFEPVDTIED